MPVLKFLPNDADEGEGLSDAGIETYRADPFPAVARETGQNSRDAHDRLGQRGVPVRLEIDRIAVASHDLPALETYKDVAARCRDLAIRIKQKKEMAFFDQALRVLSRDRIPVLRVADFNTIGLRGPCEAGSPFHSLVKSSGVSNKEDATSGGSFGIGKSAMYSASDLQTVFYSTSYTDDDGMPRFLCQGKTKFMSFTDAHGKPFRSIGYWGEPKGYLPVEDSALVPEWLRRQATGTSVFSIAVRDSDDWQNEIMASLLVNFFSAIHKGQMEFAVDGRELNRQTLQVRFDDPVMKEVTRKHADDFAFAQAMHACLTNNDDAQEHPLDVAGAGAFRLRLMVKDGLPKRIGILRNGMYVCDSLVHFGDKFSRFPMYRDFVAVLEPVTDDANVWLKQMENPRHDEFSPERLLTPEDRRAAARAGRELVDQIRQKIKEAAKPAAKDETELDELSQFFALDNKGRKDEKGVRDIESFVVKKNPPTTRTRQTKTPSPRPGGQLGGARIEHGNGGGGKGPGSGGGAGSGSKGAGTKASRKPFALLEPRTLLPADGDLRRRRVLFTPGTSGEALLTFEGTGLSLPEDLPTIPAECRVRCIEGQRQAIEVQFTQPYDGPIEIVSSMAEEGTDEAE